MAEEAKTELKPKTEPQKLNEGLLAVTPAQQEEFKAKSVQNSLNQTIKELKAMDEADKKRNIDIDAGVVSPKEASINGEMLHRGNPYDVGATNQVLSDRATSDEIFKRITDVFKQEAIAAAGRKLTEREAQLDMYNTGKVNQGYLRFIAERLDHTLLSAQLKDQRDVTAIAAASGEEQVTVGHIFTPGDESNMRRIFGKYFDESFKQSKFAKAPSGQGATFTPAAASLDPISTEAERDLFTKFRASFSDLLLMSTAPGFTAGAYPEKYKQMAERHATLIEDMEKAYGPEWKSKVALWMGKEAAFFALGSAVLNAAKPAPIVLELTAPLAKWPTTRQEIMNIAHGALEMAAYGIVKHTIEDIPKYLEDQGGKAVDYMKDAVKDILVLSGIGGVFGVLPALVGKSPGQTEMIKDIGKAAKLAAETQSGKAKDFQYFSTPEQLSLLPDDVSESARLAYQSHDASKLMPNSPLKDLQTTTAPAGELTFPLKWAKETGALDDSYAQLKLPFDDAIYTASPVDYGAITELNVAIAKKHKLLTTAVVENPDGSRTFFTDATQSAYTAAHPGQILERPEQFKKPILGRLQLQSPSQFSEMGKDFMADQRALSFMSERQLQADVKEIGSLFKGVKNDKPLQEFMLAQNHTETWLPWETARDKFNLSKEQYLWMQNKYRPYTEKMWERKNALASQLLKEQGWMAMDRQGQHQTIVRLRGPENVTGMTDDQIRKLPGMDKLIAEFEEAQLKNKGQIVFNEVLGDDALLLAVDHPIRRVQNGARIVERYDAGDIHGALYENGHQFKLAKPEDLKEPSNVIPKLAGYYPIKRAQSRYAVISINTEEAKRRALGSAPQDDTVEYLLEGNTGYFAKGFIKDNEKKYAEKGKKLVLVNRNNYTNNVEVTHPIDLITNTQGMNPKVVDQILGEISKALPDLTPEQKQNFFQAFARPFVAPTLRQRSGAQVLGRDGWKKGQKFWEFDKKTGELVGKYNPEAKPILSAKEAWEADIEGFAVDVYQGYWRDKLDKAYTTKFNKYIQDIGGTKNWSNPLLSPREVWNVKTDKEVPAQAWSEYAQAWQTKEILKRAFNQLTPFEIKMHNTVADTAGWLSDKAISMEMNGQPTSNILKALAKQSSSATLAVGSMLFDTVSAKGTMVKFKSAAAIGVFTANLTSTLTNMLSFSRALGARSFTMTPQDGALLMTDTFGLAIGQIPGFKASPKYTERLRVLNDEIFKSGILPDMRGMDEYGNFGKRTAHNIAFGTIYLGDGLSRLMGFASEKMRFQRMAQGGDKMAQSLFKDTTYKELNEQGVFKIGEEAVRFVGDMKGRDAPGASRGGAGFVTQFMANPLVKSTETYFGNQYSTAEKIKMGMGDLILWGPAAFPFVEDAYNKVTNLIDPAGEFNTDTESGENAIELLVTSISDDEETQALLRKGIKGGAFGVMTGTGLDWNAHRRFFYGTILSELTDKWGATSVIDALAKIPPATNLAVKGMNGIKDITTLQKAVSKTVADNEGGLNGLIQQKVTANETAELNAKATDIQAVIGLGAMPGLQKAMLLTYTFGLNAEYEEKYLNGKGLKIKDVQDMRFGDYLSILFGIKPDIGQTVAELNDVSKAEIDGVIELVHNARLSYATDPTVFQTTNKENIETLLATGKPLLLKTYMSRLQGAIGDTAIGEDLAKQFKLLQTIKRGFKGPESMAIDVLQQYQLEKGN